MFQLDHIVILVPYSCLADPPTWLTSYFTISAGGRHGDDKTENRLVLFRDGTYLELIAFVDDDPERRKGHWWDKPFGVVDYALTSPERIDVDALNAKLKGTGVSYVDPKEGGRKKPDGTQLRWQVTFPKGMERGLVPFFCTDLTPRERRVPVDDVSTKHPCGAEGVSAVVLEAEQAEKFRSVVEVIAESGGKVGAPIGDAMAKLEIRKGSEGLSVHLGTKDKSVADIEHEVGGGVVRIFFDEQT